VLETGADHAERKNLCSTPLRFSPRCRHGGGPRPRLRYRTDHLSHLLPCSINSRCTPKRGRPKSGLPPKAPSRTTGQAGGSWRLEDPNPTAYNAILEGMVAGAQRSIPDRRSGRLPIPISSSNGVGVDCVGPAVLRGRGAAGTARLTRVAEILTAAPQPRHAGAVALRATPERLEAELAASP